MGCARGSRSPKKHVQHLGRSIPRSRRSKSSAISITLTHFLTSPQLLLDTPSPSLWAMWDHAPAPTYTKGRIAIMGDASHATTPYQGQGAGQAIEDALVLATLLAEVSNDNEIANAFLAYDQVRRVRTQRVVSTSRDSGQLVSMRAEGVGGDLEKMKKLLSYRVHWIWNRDMEEQNREAVQLFKESL